MMDNKGAIYVSAAMAAGVMVGANVHKIRKQFSKMSQSDDYDEENFTFDRYDVNSMIKVAVKLANACDGFATLSTISVSDDMKRSTTYTSSPAPVESSSSNKGEEEHDLSSSMSFCSASSASGGDFGIGVASRIMHPLPMTFDDNNNPFLIFHTNVNTRKVQQLKVNPSCTFSFTTAPKHNMFVSFSGKCERLCHDEEAILRENWPDKAMPLSSYYSDSDYSNFSAWKFVPNHIEVECPEINMTTQGGTMVHTKRDHGTKATWRSPCFEKDTQTKNCWRAIITPRDGYSNKGMLQHVIDFILPSSFPFLGEQ
jgi:general stress protein 26